jgi:hypothetical protein
MLTSQRVPPLARMATPNQRHDYSLPDVLKSFTDEQVNQ